MTNYKFIGTGTTDATGVARLTKDPQGQTINGYVGSGNGEIDFVASLDNPIVDGSIVSETLSVLDALFYDSGTTGTPNSMWAINNLTYASITSTNEGLVLANSHTTNDYYIGINKEGQTTTIAEWIDFKDFVFEFEMVENSNITSCSFNLRPETSTAVIYYMANLNVGDIFRAEYKDGVVKLFKNNVQIGSDYNFNVGELTSIRFAVRKEKNFTIKNVKLYSI